VRRNRGGIIRSSLNTDTITSNLRTRFKILFLIKALGASKEKNHATQIEALQNSARDTATLRRSSGPSFHERERRVLAHTHIVTGFYYTVLMATYYFEIIFINFALR